MRLAVRRPTPRFTFGLRRVEPVAAIFSAFLVLATTVFIVVEAIEALRDQWPPRAGMMLVVASMALVVNGASAWLLHDVIGHPQAHAQTRTTRRIARHAHDHEPRSRPRRPRDAHGRLDRRTGMP